MQKKKVFETELSVRGQLLNQNPSEILSHHLRERARGYILKETKTPAI